MKTPEDAFKGLGKPCSCSNTASNRSQCQLWHMLHEWLSPSATNIFLNASKLWPTKPVWQTTPSSHQHKHPNLQPLQRDWHQPWATHMAMRRRSRICKHWIIVTLCAAARHELTSRPLCAIEIAESQNLSYLRMALLEADPPKQKQKPPMQTTAASSDAIRTIKP